eukprot:COSAG06_NODE_271_length_18677_cov_157.113360_4_plen_134_part_00
MSTDSDTTIISDPASSHDANVCVRARGRACVAVIWEWEYGDRSNVTRVKEKLFPLVKGEADFFSCWLQLNESDGKLHDLHDCTSESKGICAGMDSTMTLSMARRSFDVVSEMATFVGETVDPKWCATIIIIIL